MPRKSYKPEEIVAKLRQVDVLTSQAESRSRRRHREWNPELPLCRCCRGDDNRAHWCGSMLASASSMQTRSDAHLWPMTPVRPYVLMSMLG